MAEPIAHAAASKSVTSSSATSSLRCRTQAQGRRRLGLGFVLGLAAIVNIAGCGAAAQPSAAAAPEPGSVASADSGAEAAPMVDIPSAARTLDEAEATLARLVGGEAPAPAPSAEPRVATPSDSGGSPAESSATRPKEESLSDGCYEACRALSSMSRAQVRLCDLAGDEDARCADAKARYQRATERVRAACPQCTG